MTERCSTTATGTNLSSNVAYHLSTVQNFTKNYFFMFQKSVLVTLLTRTWEPRIWIGIRHAKDGISKSDWQLKSTHEYNFKATFRSYDFLQRVTVWMIDKFTFERSWIDKKTTENVGDLVNIQFCINKKDFIQHISHPWTLQLKQHVDHRQKRMWYPNRKTQLQKRHSPEDRSVALYRTCMYLHTYVCTYTTVQCMQRHTL